MKQINIWFEDEEHAELVKEKKKLQMNWHNFILELLREKLKGGKKTDNEKN